MRALSPHPHVIQLKGYCYNPLAIYLEVDVFAAMMYVNLLPITIHVYAQFCSGGSVLEYIRAHKTDQNLLLKVIY